MAVIALNCSISLLLFKDLISSELLEKWQLVDTLVQIGIALTASGSAVAGWQLWEKPEMKIVWIVISCIISLVALSHKGFRVTDKIKTWGESKKAFTMLRNQLEILRYEVNTSFGKDPDNIDKRYREIMNSYAEEDAKIPDKDLLLTKSLEDKAFSRVYESKQKSNYEEELQRSRNKYEISIRGRTNG